MLRALASASCDITQETGGTICYGHWVPCLVISYTRKGYVLLRALDSASCDILHETGGTNDLLRALRSASCDITQETGGTIGYGHWVLRLVISRTRQGGTICYRLWVLRLVISHTKQGIRCVTGIGFCVL